MVLRIPILEEVSLFLEHYLLVLLTFKRFIFYILLLFLFGVSTSISCSPIIYTGEIRWDDVHFVGNGFRFLLPWNFY